MKGLYRSLRQIFILPAGGDEHTEFVMLDIGDLLFFLGQKVQISDVKTSSYYALTKFGLAKVSTQHNFFVSVE